MLGAIIGDIVGSRFEFTNIKTKDFQLFTSHCKVTDDSIMSLAVAKALLESKSDEELSHTAIKYMQSIGRSYPNCGFGPGFRQWIFSNNPKPYNSFGNGAAMRISPVGFVAKSLEEAERLAKIVTVVSHNHEEGIKGAVSTAAAIFLARCGQTKKEIKQHIREHYYSFDFTLDSIRDTYSYDPSCQNTVPQALEAFFESESFEDAIRNAISIGGDSDTLAAICGSVAQAYYGIPDSIREKALTYLDKPLLDMLLEFERMYMNNHVEFND